MDKVGFPKDLGLSSIGFGFELPKVYFWEPSTLGLGFLGFSYFFQEF
mgnify:CR=1 FL=1